MSRFPHANSPLPRHEIFHSVTSAFTQIAGIGKSRWHCVGRFNVIFRYAIFYFVTFAKILVNPILTTDEYHFFGDGIVPISVDFFHAVCSRIVVVLVPVQTVRLQHCGNVLVLWIIMNVKYVKHFYATFFLFLRKTHDDIFQPTVFFAFVCWLHSCRVVPIPFRSSYGATDFYVWIEFPYGFYRCHVVLDVHFKHVVGHFLDYVVVCSAPNFNFVVHIPIKELIHIEP